jgi:hypothetical protein
MCTEHYRVVVVAAPRVAGGRRRGAGKPAVFGKMGVWLAIIVGIASRQSSVDQKVGNKCCSLNFLE